MGTTGTVCEGDPAPGSTTAESTSSDARGDLSCESSSQAARCWPVCFCSAARPWFADPGIATARVAPAILPVILRAILPVTLRDMLPAIRIAVRRTVGRHEAAMLPAVIRPATRPVPTNLREPAVVAPQPFRPRANQLREKDRTRRGESRSPTTIAA
jgi:hypothetical protein